MARDVHVVRAGRARTYAVRLRAARAAAQPADGACRARCARARAPTRRRSTSTRRSASLLGELRPLEERGPAADRGRGPADHGAAARADRPAATWLPPAALPRSRPAGRPAARAAQRPRRARRRASASARLLQQMPDLGSPSSPAARPLAPTRTPATGVWPGPLSIADHCVRDACPMVIGMQAVLPFGTERLFTRFFYQALTAGQPVAEALRLARLAVADDVHTGGDARELVGARPLRRRQSARAGDRSPSCQGGADQATRRGSPCDSACASATCASSRGSPSFAKPSTCSPSAVPARLLQVVGPPGHGQVVVPRPGAGGARRRRPASSR